MKFRLLIIIFLSACFLSACGDDSGEDSYGEVGIQVENLLSAPIDTFEFHFYGSAGADSIRITSLEPGELSSLYFYDDIQYHYREDSDIFFVSKGYFSIAGENYYVSNCFCDPDLKQGTLTEGNYLIRVINIDENRGNVEYEVVGIE